MEKNRECPACVNVGRDRMKDHLFLMKDGVTWACRLNGEVHEPYYERDGLSFAGEDDEEYLFGKKTLTVEDISKLGSTDDRGIPSFVRDKYQVKTSFNVDTGEITAHYYPITKNKDRKIIGYKRRKLPKYFKVIGEGKDAHFFGMLSFDIKPTHLIITEGEEDAMASHYMLPPEKISGIAHVSIPNGVNSLQAFKDNKEWLDSIDHLYLAPDYDGEAGEKLIKNVAQLFPRIKILEYSEKDANDMLLEGKKAEYNRAFHNANTYKPKSIITIKDIIDVAVERVKYGMPYSFKRMNDFTYGIKTPRSIGIGAGPGAGKTTLMQQIQKDLIFTHKEKIGIFDMENDPPVTLRRLIGAIMEKPIHLPDCIYDVKEATEIGEYLRDKVYIFDPLSYRDWEDIESSIRFFVTDKARYFFVDPISTLVDHLTPSEGNRFLNIALYRISKMIRELDISIWHVSHLRNPADGKDHGAGARVLGSQFAGSRAVWKYSTNVWGLERNQLAEDESEKNTVTLRFIKDRMGGKTGYMKLRYDPFRGVLTDTVE